VRGSRGEESDTAPVLVGAGAKEDLVLMEAFLSRPQPLHLLHLGGTSLPGRSFPNISAATCK
jgi:hypothetical protein